MRTSHLKCQEKIKNGLKAITGHSNFWKVKNSLENLSPRLKKLNKFIFGNLKDKIKVSMKSFVKLRAIVPSEQTLENIRYLGLTLISCLNNKIFYGLMNPRLIGLSGVIKILKKLGFYFG